MSKPNTTCRVCGTQYFCCGDSKAINSWRTMACTPECFKEYMKRIEESRKPSVVVPNNDDANESIVVEEIAETTNSEENSEVVTTFTLKRNKTKKVSEETVIEN